VTEGERLDTNHTAYGPVRRCYQQHNKSYIVHILDNYITYVIHNTN